MNITKTLTHRESLGWWLNEAGLTGIGVEVGCAFGQFSSRILSTWKGQELHMVDPWENLPKSEYMEEHSQVDYEGWYQQCKKLAEDDPRVKLIRKRSVEAAMQFRAASLDFVYIDGNHDYAYVLADFDAWFSKVKPGGLICGHDFYDNHTNGNWCGVASAVIRFMQEHGMVFSVTPCTSWWAIK